MCFFVVVFEKIKYTSVHVSTIKCTFCANCAFYFTKRKGHWNSKFLQFSLFQTEMSSIHDSVCTLCLNTVHFIQDVLNDTTVRNVLKDVAENLCSFAPPQLFSSCLSFVIKRLPKYYNEFIKELNPNATCAFLTLCDPSSNYLLKNSLKVHKIL